MSARLPSLMALAAALSATALTFPTRAAVSSATPEAVKAAAPVAAIEVLVLHATHGEVSFDPRIGDVPALAQPPFSSYRRYELLKRSLVRLARGAAGELELPNGRRLETRLLDAAAGGTVRLQAGINQRGAKDFLPLLEVKARRGQSFIVAGQSYRRGILVLVFRVDQVTND